jgi:hypothetical protein
MPHETHAILDSPGDGEAIWLRGDGWRVLARPRLGEHGRGEPLARFTLPDGRAVVAYVSDPPQAVTVPFSLGEAYESFVTERWRAATPARGLSAGQLDFYYRLKRFVPRRAQLAARRALIRVQGTPDFPAWPLEQSLVHLVRFYALCLLAASGKDELPFDWFWPESHRAAAILTHDVESVEGLRRAVDLADLEEARGLRSSFNIVARWYPLDLGIIEDLLARGFELGVHGVYHDRSMFASRSSFEEQLPIVEEMAERVNASGFRSPATHRVVGWLGELPVEYDCSIPHSDPFEPIPGGCCSLWPFFIGEVVELPYTLPQDHTLFTLLGRRSIDLWKTQLEAIERLHGLVQVVSHPDPGYLADRPKRMLYESFLDFLCERESLWKPLPRQVAEWWKQRDRRAPGPWPTKTARILLDDRGQVVFEL